MKQLKLFIDLTRLQKPIGFMLLFWPCIWGLTIAYNFQDKLNQFIFFLVLKPPCNGEWYFALRLENFSIINNPKIKINK